MKYARPNHHDMLKAVLFDLDGTLLPMDQDRFTEYYFSLLAKRMASYGYDPKALIDTVWKGISAMMRNDGSRTNREAFWEVFSSVFGKDSPKDEPIFERFYMNEFQQVKSVCEPTPKAREIVSMLRENGIRVILATNPIFPKVATDSRIRWAGMEPEDFDMYTTFENFGFSKPNPDYFRELLRMMELSPEECIMVGNDVDEDMVASEIGMKVFLLDHDMINRKGKDISRYPKGDFDALIDFLRTEMKVD